MKPEAAKSAGDNATNTPAEKKEKKKKYKVDDELLRAFRYFDRNCESMHCLLIALPFVIALSLQPFVLA